MVKAPEKFLDKYSNRQKSPGKKQPKVHMRKISEEEAARLGRNLKMLWDIYRTPEIKEILSKEHRIPFLNIEGIESCLSFSFVDKGILLEYEMDMGSKKELAGARIFKQAEMILNRYFTFAKGAEEMLKTSHVVLKPIVDVFIEKEICEADVWDAIAKGNKIHVSLIPEFA